LTRYLASFALVTPLIPAVALAQLQPLTNSLPQAQTPIGEPIPAARDVAFAGVIQLQVDASDVARGIVEVTETIPVTQTGQVTLLYPEWIPGDHSPTGPIDKLAGLTISVDGQAAPWTRDQVDVYAFHLDVPAGAHAITAKFQYLSPTRANQGRIQATPEMLSLQWDKVSLYPAGYYVRRLPYAVSVVYPAGWKSATALAPGLSGDRVTYSTTDYETLVDSPAIAGLYMKSWALAADVNLNVAADEARDLEAAPEQIAAHRRLVDQAERVFGARHYDHYDFLLTLSDTLGGEGLEHHRSSEDGTDADYFTNWDATPDARNLLPHEYTHSWDGKYRRPADLWTPDYRQPMGDSLLWVYEGQTQYWGYVLQARSGLASEKETLDALAEVAASYQNQPGKSWRPTEDTTNDPTMSQRRAEGWRSWQRAEDYYSEGQLTWLDADQLIREKTNGRRSLDDFARAFFGGRDRDWGVKTYNFDDVVSALNLVLPFDWAAFLRERLYAVQPKAPLDWIERGGYRLTYTAEPNGYVKEGETASKGVDLSHSLGLATGRDGAVSSVQWNGPAFAAGLTSGATIVAVNGRDYDNDGLRRAVTLAATTRQPIRLIVKQQDEYRTVSIPYYNGLRYAHLEKVAKGTAGLDRLLAIKS
jgi:predicted metalloprotease with PDZ domain